jgi:hypothetical protein
MSSLAAILGWQGNKTAILGWQSNKKEIMI